MIQFDNISVKYNPKKLLLDQCSFLIETGARLIVEAPDSRAAQRFTALLTGDSRPIKGQIYRSGRMSWVLNKTETFSNKYYLAELIKFYGGVYGRSPAAIENYLRVQFKLNCKPNPRLSDLDEPSKGALMAGMPFAVGFDTYVFHNSLKSRWPDLDEIVEAELNGLGEEKTVIQVISRPDQAAAFGADHYHIDHGGLHPVADERPEYAAK